MRLKSTKWCLPLESSLLTIGLTKIQWRQNQRCRTHNKERRGGGGGGGGGRGLCWMGRTNSPFIFETSWPSERIERISVSLPATRCRPEGPPRWSIDGRRFPASKKKKGVPVSIFLLKMRRMRLGRESPQFFFFIYQTCFVCFIDWSRFLPLIPPSFRQE